MSGIWPCFIVGGRLMLENGEGKGGLVGGCEKERGELT
jgi:hypothetical protein